MKIPILHQLEKKIRALRRGGNSSVKSKRYQVNFNRFLSDHNYHEQLKPAHEKTPQLADPSEPPLVSIIIPCFNQYEYTFKCIHSIYHNTESTTPYEIILIDDYSTDKTKEIETQFPDIKVIRNKTNKGFLKNVNQAAQKAKGKYLLLLNNDTIVLKKWLTSMIEVFENFDDVGVVGSKLIFPNGMLQEAGGFVTKDGHFGNYGKFQSIFDPRFNYIREVDYVSGASLMIKSDLWKELKGFDEIYLPAYFEDTDLCMRVREKGYRVLYTPFSNIIHFESISYGTNLISTKRDQMEKNQITFVNRWEEEMNKTHVTKEKAEPKNHERTVGKPTILYIDNEPPNDYQAGSKLSKIYCDLLSKMGYTVKFLPMHINRHNAVYIKALQAKGIECCYSINRHAQAHALNPEDQTRFPQWFRERLGSFDFYLLARPESANYLEVIKQHQPNAKYYYHPADIHFLRAERAQALSKNGLTKKELKEKTQELSMLKNAKRVLHVSTYENNLLKKDHDIENGVIIPCYFFPNSNQEANHRPRTELLYVGSNHEASRDGIEWFLREIFQKIRKKYPDTILNIIGSSTIKVSEQTNVKLLGRVSAEELEEHYLSCIPIIPLRYGAGVKGKVLEAMYYNAPFVSTCIGLEGIPDIESAKKPADSPTDFAAEICAILENPTHQDTEIDACKKIIETHFTEQTARKTLESIFRKRLI
jgi:GT2 family glycosyltransferase/glycosyltransferase involved in cell wall biosynthesis